MWSTLPRLNYRTYFWWKFLGIFGLQNIFCFFILFSVQRAYVYSTPPFGLQNISCFLILFSVPLHPTHAQPPKKRKKIQHEENCSETRLVGFQFPSNLTFFWQNRGKEILSLSNLNEKTSYLGKEFAMLCESKCKKERRGFNMKCRSKKLES